MSLTWAELRTQAKRLLQDNKSTGTPRWSNDQLLDYASWALNSLCAHTALATATGFTCDGVASAFTLPNNFYEEVTRSGAVYIDDGFSVSYLNPVPIWKHAGALNGYYLNPSNILNTVMVPSNGSILTIYYFASYPIPVNDNDLILAPAWATAALVFAIGSYAHSSYATKTASIRQWNTKSDSGNPEQNPIEDMSRVYYERYQMELLQVPNQQRENYWRNNLINGHPKPVII